MSEPGCRDYVEDLAATMLASTLGIEFDPDAAWDERKRVYEMSDLIVDTFRSRRPPRARRSGDWTCVVAAAVFLFTPSPPVTSAMTGAATFDVPPTFLGVDRNDRDAAVCVAGIPLDLGTTNRGRRPVRTGGDPTGEPDAGGRRRIPCTGSIRPRLPLADIGDFAIALGDIPASLARIEATGRAGSSIWWRSAATTASPCRCCARWRGRRGPPALIHFDAHVDTWPDKFGQPTLTARCSTTPSRKAWSSRGG